LGGGVGDLPAEKASCSDGRGHACMGASQGPARPTPRAAVAAGPMLGAAAASAPREAAPERGRSAMEVGAPMAGQGGSDDWGDLTTGGRPRLGGREGGLRAKRASGCCV
jgi:hypothetical protein